MNILKVQDTLKNLSDSQLAQEIRMPSGAAPQFLVMTEMQRRQKMRAAAQNTGERPSIAEEMAGEAPPAQMPSPEGAPPAEPPPQAAGIMGLPDATAAGNVMKARITGQPQQVGDMTAMPPQGMAEGGAVQFGNIFGDMKGNAGMQASQTPDLIRQNYMPANGYVDPKTNDYGKIKNQFDPYNPPKGTPNPRVRMSDAERYGLPAGMAAPTYGTPGLNRTITGRDGQNTRYSWANDAARDAYIRYMTPQTTTNTGINSATAAQNAASTVPTRAMAEGGPIRMGSGAVAYGGPETSAGGDWWRGLFANPYPVESLERLPPSIRSKEIQRILEMKEGEGPFASRPADNPDYIPQTRKAYEDMLARSEAEAEAARNDTMFPFAYKRGELDAMKAAREAALAKAQGINPVFPSREVGAPRPQAAAPQAAATPATPTQLDINQNYDPNAPEPRLMTGPEMAQPNLPDLSGLPSIIASQAAAKRKGSIAPSDNGPIKQEAPGQVGGNEAPVVPKSRYEELAMEKLNALRGDAAADRQSDINMALMQAGLGMAASKNRNFLGALAEGASPALSGFTEARRLAKKDQRELTASELGVLGNVENIRSQEAARAAADRQFDVTTGLSREQLGLTRKQLENQAGAARTANEIALETLAINKAKVDQLPDDFRTLEALHKPGNEALLAAYNASNGSKEAKLAQSYIDGYNTLIGKGIEPTAEQTQAFGEAMSVVRSGFGRAGATTADPRQQLYGRIANSLLSGQKPENIAAALKSQFPNAEPAEIEEIIANAQALAQQQ